MRKYAVILHQSKGLPYSTEKQLEWARENCPSYVGNASDIYLDTEIRYIFYFASADEALMFALRWA